jgi:hypothetical protein
MSLRAANELLQKELLSGATPRTTWETNKNSTHINGDVNASDEWSLKTAKNHTVKSRKQGQSATAIAGQVIKTVNRYTPLAKVHADNVGTIPVIVNDISTKRRAKVNNRNTSCRVNGGIGEKKWKKKKIIVIGYTQVRGCARGIANCFTKEFEFVEQ